MQLSVNKRQLWYVLWYKLNVTEKLLISSLGNTELNPSTLSVLDLKRVFHLHSNNSG